MLVEIFGEYPQIKVLEYLLSTPFVEHTKLQIAVGSDISRITLNKFIDTFIEKEIIIKTSKNKYLLNLKTPIVQNLNIFVDNMNKTKFEEDFANSEEDYDELSDEELNQILDENAPDVDLNRLENEIIHKENSLLFIEYLKDETDEYSLIFANSIK